MCHLIPSAISFYQLRYCFLMSSEVENIKYYIKLDTAVNFHLPVYYVLLNYFTSTIEMIGFVNEPLFI